MRLTAIALVLCACVWLSTGDVAHLKSAKVKLLGRLAGSKHHKRGVLSSVPPFKLGHDIPLVTHSVVKPLVVTYPPTAAVTAVKVPLSHPLLHRYPVGVGHRVPVPHPHYGLKFPHHTKTLVVPKPDQHFHHHHHHVSPRPVVPVVPAPAPVVPLPAPTIAHHIPAPLAPLAPAHPTAALVPQHAPFSPALQVLTPNHVHLRPVLPSAPVLPVAPPPLVAPAYPYASQFPYVLRPGSAIQSSVFATYPRYPFSNFPTPLFPLSSSSFSQIVPHQYLVPQAEAQDGVAVEQPAAPPALVHAHGEVQPGLHPLPGQPEIHLQSAQPGVLVHPEQGGVHLHSVHPDQHLQPGVHVQGQHDIHLQPTQPGFNLQPAQPEIHLPAAQPDYHLQQGHPDIHLHAGQPDYHIQPGHPDVHLHTAQPDYPLQPGQPDVHLQPYPDFHFQSGTTDFHLQPGVQPQPTQPTVDHNGWSPVPAQPSDIGQADGQYPNDGHHHFAQDQGGQGYEHHTGDDQYHDFQHQLQHHIQQQIEQAQYEQHINSQHQPAQEYGAPQSGAQPGQEYPQPDYSQQQPAAEYGAPGGAEGRSADAAAGEGEAQLYHNHIPLGLQPPIDRPLDHFR